MLTRRDLLRGSVSCWALSSLAAVPSRANSLPEGEIDRLVGRYMALTGTPGLSLGILKEGKIIYAKGYGLADVENGVPSTPDTVYQIASVTKVFTAALVLKLVEQGKIGLDVPTQVYLPELPSIWSGVTVRRLLNHTAGLQDYVQLPAVRALRLETDPYEELKKLVRTIKQESSPGEKYAYESSSYFVLGEIIERIAGKPFAQVLRDEILNPLGMTASRMNRPSDIILHRAKGYDPNPGRGPRNAIDLSSLGSAAGGMVSSVSDLAKWDAALYGDTVLKQATWKEAWTSDYLNDQSAVPYGFGWRLGTLNGFQTVAHSGDIPGFTSQLLRIPSEKLTVIVLCNAMPGGATQLARHIAPLADLILRSKTLTDNDSRALPSHKALLQALLDGGVSSALFSPAGQHKLFPDLIARIIRRVGGMGAIQSFELTSLVRQGGSQARTYAATVGIEDLEIVVQTTGSLIDDLSVRVL